MANIAGAYVILSSAKENKPICEVATGAERTFATGVCFMSPCTFLCVCVCVYLCLCVCRSHFGWLAGWFNRCFGCHWLAWLVINRAWLHAGMNRKGLTTHRSRKSAFTDSVVCTVRMNETFLKNVFMSKQCICVGFSLGSHCPFFSLFGCHHSSVCENEK